MIDSGLIVNEENHCKKKKSYVIRNSDTSKHC